MPRLSTELFGSIEVMVHDELFSHLIAAGLDWLTVPQNFVSENLLWRKRLDYGNLHSSFHICILN